MNRKLCQNESNSDHKMTEKKNYCEPRKHSKKVTKVSNKWPTLFEDSKRKKRRRRS